MPDDLVYVTYVAYMFGMTYKELRRRCRDEGVAVYPGKGDRQSFVSFSEALRACLADPYEPTWRPMVADGPKYRDKSPHYTDEDKPGFENVVRLIEDYDGGEMW